MSNESVIRRYVAAMRKGAAAEDEMMSLFAEDAVYIEPFTGSDDPAVGRRAVRDRLRLGWEQPLPDLELDVLDVQIDGDSATSRWECRSTALPGPVRGTDRYDFAGGRITRLEVAIDAFPDAG